MMPGASEIDGPPIADAARAPIATEVCAELPLTPPAGEIYRCLGYPRDVLPPPPLQRTIAGLVATALPRLQPRGTYSLYRCSTDGPHSLALGGLTIRGRIGEFLHGADRVAVFLVTVGDAISRLADGRCGEGDAMAGSVLDAVGSWAAEAAANALMQRLQARLGADDALTVRYSPGYCGMDLAEQRNLFRLAPAGAIGVTLLPSLLMQPLKSISGIVGLGHRDAVRSDLTPCDLCPLLNCHMRR